MQRNEPIDAETLLSTPLPPVRWLIPGLLPAGLSLLAGASKAGKSWLCLWLCLQLARGGEIWGRTAQPQTVLYLCLEDTYARIQGRLFRLTEDSVPSRLYFQTGSCAIGDGLELQIEKFLSHHPETGLVVIDTLQKVRTADPNNGAYASDYPYFKEKGITLAELEAKDLKEFYRSERIGDPEHGIAGKKGTTVARYHANIHAALECAVEDNLIGHNAAHHQRPTTEKFIGSFYTPEEALECMRLAEGTKLELAVYFGLFYGLRRSEIVGLQWHNFDFEHNTFTIAHTVTTYRRKGKGKVSRYAKDKTKNKSSLRTLPLIPLFREKLLALKEKQKYERELFKGSYVKDYIGYVYVNEIGELIHPDYISTEFPKFLRKHGLRKIRFHDTRHSCASLLLRNGVSMKQIQAWLGHSDYGTTANLYAHLDLEDSMLLSASMLTTGLFGASTDHAPSTDSELTDPRHGTAP